MNELNEVVKALNDLSANDLRILQAKLSERMYTKAVEDYLTNITMPKNIARNSDGSPIIG